MRLGSLKSSTPTEDWQGFRACGDSELDAMKKLRTVSQTIDQLEELYSVNGVAS